MEGSLLQIIATILMGVAESATGSKREVRSWNRDKRFEYYCEAIDYYDSDQRSHEASRRLIRRAELLHVPRYVIDQMEEECKRRSSDAYSYLRKADDKELRLRARSIINDMQEDMGTFIGQRHRKIDVRLLLADLDYLGYQTRLAYRRWQHKKNSSP